MENKFMSGLKTANNYTVTENGAVTHKSTESDLLDLFAMGAAYRTRTDEDVIVLFHNAYKAAEKYGMAGNLVAGANIAGFEKVAQSMIAQGVAY